MQNNNNKTRLKSFIGGLVLGLIAGSLAGIIASSFLFGSLMLSKFESQDFYQAIK